MRRLLLAPALAALLCGCVEMAARHGDTEAVRRALDGGRRPSSEMLHQAGISDSVDTVKLLLDRGADPRDGAFDYVLNALQFGSTRTAVYLARHGAPVSADALAEAGKRDIGAQRELQAIASGGAAQAAAPSAAAPRAAAEPPAAEPAKASDVDAPSYNAKAEREDDYAVVVGVEKYPGLPAAEYAERDARAFHAHLRALGLPERNIFLLTDAAATRSGLAKNLETRLPKLVDGKSTVFFYYSGHGAPDPRTGQAYLLPVDGDPAFLEDTAYPLSRLYQKLGALPARRVIVALDSCFSGAGGRSVLAKGARPLVTQVRETPAAGGKIVALTASAGDEISGTRDDQGHGLFTYYLLKGLNEGKRSTGELYRFLKPKVQDEARRENRDQTPALTGQDAPL
jgi:hypothetical protein